MKKFGVIFLAIVVLFVLFMLVVVVPYFLITSVKQTTDRALAPIQEANRDLKTQVNQILNPTPTIIPDPATIIQEVRSLARLETIQYTVEKVVTAETGNGELSFLFGDKLLFVAHGKVIAGYDLARLTTEDMILRGDVLIVNLPKPEIFIATLDNNRSYVYDRQTGLLTHGDQNLETEVRKVAEREILNAALEDGILEQAQVNGENYLTRLFNALGYKQVIFQYSNPQP